MDARDHKKSGAMLWLNDIEVNKAAYLGMLGMLLAGLFLVYTPLVEVRGAFGGSIILRPKEIEGLQWIVSGVTVLNAASLAIALIPMAKFFEWKYKWFVTVGAVALIETCVGAWFLVSVDQFVEHSWTLGFFAAPSVRFTFSGWLLVASFVLTLVCAAAVTFSIYKNRKIYQYG